MNIEFPFSYFGYQESTAKWTEIFRSYNLRIKERRFSFLPPFDVFNRNAFDRLQLRYNTLRGTMVFYDHNNRGIIAISMTEDYFEINELIEVKPKQVTMLYEGHYSHNMISHIVEILRNHLNAKSDFDTPLWNLIDSVYQAQYTNLIYNSNNILSELNIPKPSAGNLGTYEAAKNKNTIFIYDEALQSELTFLGAFAEEALGPLNIFANDLISFERFSEDCLRGNYRLGGLEVVEFESFKSYERARRHPEIGRYLRIIRDMGLSIQAKITA